MAANEMVTGKVHSDGLDTVLCNPERLPERATPYIEASYNRRILLDCGAEGYDLWVRHLRLQSLQHLHKCSLI
jgi:hypothetical protein